MPKLSIKQLLSLSASILCTLLVLGTLIIWNSNASLEAASTEASRAEQGVQAFKDTRFHVAHVQESLTDAALVGESDVADAAKQRDQALAKLDRLAALLPERQAAINDLRGPIKRLYEIGEQMVHAYIKQGREAGNALMKEEKGFDSSAEMLEKQLETLAGELQTLAERSEAVQSETRRAMLRFSMGVTALAFAFVLLSHLLVFRVLIKLLGGEPAYAGEITARIATGDLTQIIRIKPDDQDSLLAHIGAMQQGLGGTVATIRDISRQVLSAAERLNADAERVVKSSLAQTDAASGMAASVEEMSVSIEQVAQHARDAQRLSGASGQVASQGAEVIRQAVGAMQQITGLVRQASTTVGELGHRSQDISAVVQVIREIAEQTNLLALNAAIEAARAGEQGRGFAVVADEVRKLAERTATSTRSIGEMITGIQDGARAAVEQMAGGVVQVEHGGLLADQAGHAIGEIDLGTREVIGAVGSISGAISEQSIASQTIAQGVEQIAQMAEANHSAAQGTTASTQALQELAAHLDQALGRFRVA